MKKGFTLIELLIVIALLGTLAVALLAAIDPFEQFKKGTDTGVRNTTQEVYNAAIRYYAQRSDWPSGWDDTGVWNGITIGESDPGSVVEPLITAGELKSNFIEIADDQLNKIYVAITGSSILSCFSPESKSFRSADANTKYSNPQFTNGVPTTDTLGDGVGCILDGGTDVCYWCIY